MRKDKTVSMVRTTKDELSHPKQSLTDKVCNKSYGVVYVLHLLYPVDIFLQQYFPIPLVCNITRYCTGVFTRALELHAILASMMCFN